MPRPHAIILDMVETTFSLQPIRDLLIAEGQGEHALDLFFAAMLRDAFALDTCGIYRPFRAMAESQLGVMGLPAASRDRVLAGFADLPAHPDIAPALDHAAARGVPVLAVTNGAADVTEGLLKTADLRDGIARIISIDEIGRWKPAAAVYAYAAAEAGAAPHDMALVAAHGWDVAGARRAGMTGAYVTRTGPFPDAMDGPEIVADDVASAFGALLD